MALVLGTNCGFVLVAPVDDPGGTMGTIDTYAYGFKVTSPTGAIKIIEIGWWCDGATQAANFDVGIYSHDATNNRPNTLIGSALNNAKGTTVGWKKVIGLNIVITPGTIYWIGVQLDDTATATRTDYTNLTGQKFDWKSAQTSLPSTWGTSTGTSAGLLGFYVVYEAEETGVWPPDRPVGYNPDLYWDEATEVWVTTRKTGPGNLVDFVVVVGEEGEVYFGKF
jgi:hypothetical protein